MAILIFQGTTVEELVSKIEDVVSKKLKEEISALKPQKDYEFWDTDQTAEFLRISKVTLHKWKKLKYLNPYRMGRRILFRSDEVEASLKRRNW
jgi:excisionase family DNA binding protein